MKRLSFLLVTLVACAGTQEEAIKPLNLGPSPAAPAKRMTSADVSFEIPAIELKGAVFEPEATGKPGMPLVDPKLKQSKTTDALASAGPDKPDDKAPELASAMAWAKLRTGDGAGAWQAIGAAARGWGQNANREDLEREVLWFAGRTVAPLD